MARYADLYHQVEAELKQLKAQTAPVDRLIAHSCLVDALLAVVMRHGLLDEFAKELSEREARLNAIPAPDQDPPVPPPNPWSEATP